MAEIHPTASHHLPAFITSPGATDVLMVVTGIILLLAVMMFGILFLRLHALPEQIAHKSHKIQFEIVAVLCLIALFTHMHIFWIAGLLLAMIDLPDFGSSLNRIAGSAEKIAGIRSEDSTTEAPAKIASEINHADAPSPADAGVRKDGDGSASPTKPESTPMGQKEPIHA
jgi:hypothetical protein